MAIRGRFNAVWLARPDAYMYPCSYFDRNTNSFVDVGRVVNGELSIFSFHRREIADHRTCAICRKNRLCQWTLEEICDIVLIHPYCVGGCDTKLKQFMNMTVRNVGSRIQFVDTLAKKRAMILYFIQCNLTHDIGANLISMMTENWVIDTSAPSF